MAAPLTLSSRTNEYVRVPVSATEDGVDVDPTNDTVEFAAPAVGDEPTVWVEGEWETSTDRIWARILVSGTGGGGTLEIADGTWDLWIRITDSPETPARKVGPIRMT